MDFLRFCCELLPDKHSKCPDKFRAVKEAGAAGVMATRDMRLASRDSGGRSTAAR